MGVGLAIFSRFDSRRLPGKALLAIGGRPLLGHVVDRTRKLAGAVRVVIATSERAVDDPIAAFARANGVDAFRGSCDDVLGRALDCALAFGFDHLVRISGDSPFMDPALIERLIRIHLAERPDLTTNVFPRTFPAGLSVEVVSRTALETAAPAADARQREHVTPFFYEHPERFRIRNEISGIEGWDEVSLTVDTPDDLEKARWIAAALADGGDAGSIGTIVELARSWQQGR